MAINLSNVMQHKSKDVPKQTNKKKRKEKPNNSITIANYKNDLILPLFIANKNYGSVEYFSG